MRVQCLCRGARITRASNSRGCVPRARPRGPRATGRRPGSSCKNGDWAAPEGGAVSGRLPRYDGGATQPNAEETDMPYTRISADSHIDLPWLPNDLFTANATAALRDRMPYVTDGPDGPHWTCKNGMSFGLVCGVGPGGAKYVPGQNYRVDKMA